MSKVTITDEDGILLREKFVKFLEFTKLYLDRGWILRRRGFWNEILTTNIANIFFHYGKVRINVCQKNLFLVKKLAEDFSKKEDVEVNISLGEDDC